MDIKVGCFFIFLPFFSAQTLKPLSFLNHNYYIYKKSNNRENQHAEVKYLLYFLNYKIIYI